MVVKEAVKKNQSSLQVLKTLQLLLQGNYSMTELIQMLNKNEKEPIFNNSVVSKYINTCRYCGIEIPKIHNKYFVAGLPFGLNITSGDLDLLDELHYMVKNTMAKKYDEIYSNFIKKLSKYSNKQILRVEEKTKQKVFQLFDSAISEKRKVNLMFRAKSVIKCIPLGIVQKKGKSCFNVIHNGKEKVISADRISGIEVTDEKYTYGSTQEVVFKLKGGLAERYTLRENEQVVSKNLPEEMVVSNIGEEKEALFARLLRYDSCCEILYPVHYREEMKNLIDEMLDNYGV